MVIGLFIYMFKNCVYDLFMMNETNSILTRSYHMSQQLDYNFLECVYMLYSQIVVLTISHVRISSIMSDL